MRLDQTATGKCSTAGWLTRNAPQPPSHGSASRKPAAEPRGRKRGPRGLLDRRAACDDGGAFGSSGSERATRVPAPTRLSK